MGSTLRAIVSLLAFVVPFLFSGSVLAMEPIRTGDTVVITDSNGKVDHFVYQGDGAYHKKAGGTYKVNPDGQLLERSDGMRFSPHEGQYPPSGKFVLGDSWSHEYQGTKNGKETDLKRECKVVAVGPYMVGSETITEAATIECTVKTVVGFFSSEPSVTRTHIEVRAPKEISGLPLRSTISWANLDRPYVFSTTAIQRAVPPKMAQKN